MNLLHWLKKTPQPVCVVADDQKIPVPRNARAYKDLLATIKSLAPSKLSCLDKDGNVIRATVLEDDAENAAAAAVVSAEMNDLQVFARLLAEAYDRGARTNQPLVDRAMEFVERNADRIAKTEVENDRLRAQIHKMSLQYLELSSSAHEVEQQPASGDDSLMGAVVQGVLQAQGLSGLSAVPKPAAANGKPSAVAGAKSK